MNEKKEIILTPQELEELKDDIKFRTKVIMQLKQLNGLPERVIKLETHCFVHWTLIIILIGGVLGLGWRVLAQ